MASTPRSVDMQNHPRRAQFEYFSQMANPYVGVTVNVDLSALAAWRSRTGAPFFLSLLYAVSRAANAVPELRRRIRPDGRVVEYDWCPSSHIVLKPDESYAYCTLSADKPLDAFLAEGTAAQRRCTECGTLDDADPEPLIFISTLPWLSYTALVQPTPMPADSNPRITWGRCFQENGRTLVPMTLLAHHALLDGLHISRFYQALDTELKRSFS